MVNLSDPIVIVGAKRTPLGGFQGALSLLAAPELGGHAIKASIDHAGLNYEDVENVIMGCVLQAGQGQAPARQAAFKGGCDESVPCVTLNKMCGSGLQAVMYAHDLVALGTHKIVVAGGMESMSNAPYLLPKARSGMRMGHGEVYDHMFLDGLEDAYDRGQLMGGFADKCASEFEFTREQQDAFALESLSRAQDAAGSGFDQEIASITIKSRKGENLVMNDEQPQNARPDKIPQLKPAFSRDGTVTAANASSISDGAAALVLMRASEAEKRGLTPLVKILGHAVHARAPEWFTTAPIGAITSLCYKLNCSPKDFDLYEINEAFAVVAMAAIQELGLDHSQVNVNGGACALGHPIGASGARILVTLIHALKARKLKTGIASLCIGGGEAVALAIESWE